MVLLLALLIGAFWLRLAGAAGYTEAALQDDHGDYHAIARNLLSGVGYVQAVEFAYGRQPAWPYLLAGAYALGGVHLRVGAWLLAALGTLTVALTWRLGWQIGTILGGGGPRTQRLSDVLGLTAALLVMVDPFLIAQDQALLAESLFTCALTATIWVTLRPPTVANGALVGALIGVMTLTRSNGITLLLAVTLVTLVDRRGWRWWLTVVGVAGVTLIPWAVRNWRVIGTLTPLAPQSGQLILGCYNQFTLNAPEAAGMWLYPRELPEGREYAGLPYLDRERIWAQIGLDVARDNLDALPRLMSQRLARWLLQPIFLSRPQLEVRLLAAQPMFHLLLLIGSLSGALFLLIERGGRVLWAAFAWLLPAAITVALLYGEARFRVPYHPLLACLTAVVVARLLTFNARRATSPARRKSRTVA